MQLYENLSGFFFFKEGMIMLKSIVMLSVRRIRKYANTTKGAQIVCKMWVSISDNSWDDGAGGDDDNDGNDELDCELWMRILGGAIHRRTRQMEEILVERFTMWINIQM